CAGSITLDRNRLEAADVLPGEMVLVVNLSNGARLETYAIEAPAGSGTVCLNGPAARLAEVGDLVHVISYCYCDDQTARTLVPRIVAVDEKNQPTGK
ncbi:MAG: aspartate 1-decarboxylase, partial [Armatimonadetes bacterium]|nr:aspartate 1-decarboxylase [Armatimonadota bacterium]